MILLTDEISSIIDPILSRCRIFFFRSLSEKSFSDKIDTIAPLAYADFEGVIPEGEYGGGTVMLLPVTFSKAAITARLLATPP